MLDFAGPGLKKMMNKKVAGMLQNAPFEFAPENGLAYFEDLGWRSLDVQPLLMAANRFRRLPMFMRPVVWVPQPESTAPGQKSLERDCSVYPLSP